MIKKIYFFVIFLFLVALTTNAQVGIGTTTPNSSSTLDVVSTNSGVLIPRIILTATNVAAPVTSPATSLLIYNTATAGAGLTAVSPGYYYWDGTQWVRLQSGISSNDWSLLGNSGTNASTNFLGTTDDNDLIFRRNNTRAGRLASTSTSFGLNALNPASTGPQNTAFGVNALASHTTSFNNTAIGYNTLTSVTTLGANTAVGANALRFNANTFSTSVGAFAGENNNGSSNVIMGYSAMRNNTGGANTVLGYNAMSGGSGSNNIALGFEVMRDQAGNNNIGIGYQAALTSNVGSFNIALGDFASNNRNDGRSNIIAIGRNAMRDTNFPNSSDDFSSKIAIGYDALNGANNATGSSTLIAIGKNNMRGHQGTRNIGIGDFTFDGALTFPYQSGGSDNVALGNGILRRSFGSNNTIVGSGSFANNTTGQGNTSIGAYVSQQNTTGSFNTSLGYFSHVDNQTGNHNLSLGYFSNRGNYGGSRNTVLGTFAGGDFGLGDRDGNILIGYRSGFFETNSDRLYIDNSDTTTPLIYGELDTNILRTNGTLQVNIPGSGGYAFPNVDGTNGQVLTSNGAGAVSWQSPGAAAAGWLLGGNAATNPATQFLGTTDAQDLVFRTNNLERARISSNGFMAVNGPINAFGRFYSFTNTSGIDAVVGEASSFGSAGIIGYGNNAGGYGTFGYNTASGVGALGSSIFGSASTRIGVVGISTGSLFGSITGFNLGSSSVGLIGTFGLSTGAAATTRYGGIFAYDTDNSLSSSIDPNSPIAQLAGYDATRSIYYGGYFAGGQDYTGVFNGGNAGTNANAVDYAYVGARFGTTNYKIIGNGSVSTIIDGENDKKHVMFAPESPEILFQDYGVGQLVNGQVRIAIDPILAKNIYVDENHPLKVFVQLKGDCNGVYVTDESSTGFTVKELQSGTSNVKFSYQIVANRADRKDATGKVVSKHVNVRLPDAPTALERARIEKQEIKKINK